MAAENENLVPCPCCGEGLVEAGHEFDICEVCGWEDDDYQFNHPDYCTGRHVPEKLDACPAGHSDSAAVRHSFSVDGKTPLYPDAGSPVVQR